MDLSVIKEIGTTLGTIAAAVVIFIITFKKSMSMYLIKKKENIPEKIKRQTEIDAKILKKMEQTKELLGADRIVIFDFHNGEHYANGRSALKMSISYEVTRYGIKKIQKTMQGIPLSMFPNLIKKLLDNKKFDVKNINDFKTLEPEYSICFQTNMKSFYNNVILNEHSEIVGFVSIHFKDIKDNINFTELGKLVWTVEEYLKELL